MTRCEVKMKSMCRSIVFLSVLAVSMGFLALRAFERITEAKNSGFEPAELVSAEEVRYPLDSISIGTVVLEATVGRDGAVVDAWTVRGIETLNQPAIASVKKWRFKPASLQGTPVQSRTTIAVTFNPAAVPATDVPLPPVSENKRADASSQPQPVRVIAAAFPQYPLNSVTTGTVVLRVTVDDGGQAHGIVAVRKITSLTSSAIRAMKLWKFQAAEFHGEPCSSSVALAFVLRPPSP